MSFGVVATAIAGSVASAAVGSMLSDGGGSSAPAQSNDPGLPPLPSSSLGDLFNSSGQNSVNSPIQQLFTNKSSEDSINSALPPILRALGGLANGGQVDELDLLKSLKQAILQGRAKTIPDGGKVTGKQSKSGDDNQVVALAGGEGVIPKDVMEVNGVPELLRSLISTYHTEVK